MKTTSLAATVAWILFALGTGGAAAQEIKKYAQEFYHDFRGKPLPVELRMAGKHNPEFIRWREPEGLRITLPNTFIHEFGGVSVRSTFGIQGDFEVTGTIELLHMDVPAKGFGVGTRLRVPQTATEEPGATLGRLVRAGGHQILVWDRVPAKPKEPVGGVHKCTEKSLRLRFKRTGTTLHYLWAPGLEGGEFEEIRAEKEFGAGDITAVRMNAITGQQPVNVDVRFVDLRIRSGGPAAENVPAVAPQPNNPAPQQPDPESRGRGWLSAAAIIGGALVLVFTAILGVALLLRRGKPEPKGENATITFACPACGKSLKTNASTAGKKIACSKCRQMVKVPRQGAIKQAD